jgi:hypothetical protein
MDTFRCKYRNTGDVFELSQSELDYNMLDVWYNGAKVGVVSYFQIFQLSQSGAAPELN